MPFQKQKLLFVPHYLGSLKYFEKLIPCLRGKYEVFFLLLPHIRQGYLNAMVQYCEERSYRYHLMKKYLPSPVIDKIPFCHSLAMILHYKKQVKKILRDSQIKKIVSVFDSGFYYYLLRKSAQSGIETMVLQWAFTGEEIFQKKPFKFSFSLKFFYGWLVNCLIKLLLSGFQKAKAMGGGSSQKFGVINQYAYFLFKKAGVPAEKISVVGSMDFYETEKTTRELSDNAFLKNQLATKLNINLNKKNIVIYSTPFNTKDTNLLFGKEQFDYYETIIKIIREVFPLTETDILLKIHPAEEITLYSPLQKYGLKIYGKETTNPILIFFAALYIAHHSTANFIPIIMKKPAIFINFLNLPAVSWTQKGLGIKKYIQTEEEFKKLLFDFKNNRLERQYHLTEEIFTKNSLEKIIKWIG